MKKILIALVVIAAFGALAGYRINARIQNDKAAKARTVEVVVPAVSIEAVTRRPLQARVRITGNVRPANEVEIFPKAAGRVQAVNVELGDKVRKGQALARIEQSIAVLQLKQAAGALEAARANLENAKKNAESAEQLAKTENIPDVQLVGARAGLQAARAGVIQAEAAVGLARESVTNTVVTSPIDGVITRKNVNIGMMAAPGAMGPNSALFQVQDVSSLKLETTIDEKEVNLVHLGQPVRFKVDSWPDVTFEGTVRRISPSLDAASRRASIEVAVQNPDGKLYANMFARGEILQEGSHEVLAIPQAALVKGASSVSVYVVQGETVKLKTITVGETDGNYVAVRDGLAEGEQIVTSGHSKLSDGGPVKVASATNVAAGTDSAAGPMGAAGASTGDAPQSR